MRCVEVEELAGAYALLALPQDERAAVREHLGGCSKHPSMPGLVSVAQSLAMAAPEMVPSATLKARLMEVVLSEPAPAAGATAPKRRSGERFAWLRNIFSLRLPPYALSGALAVIAVALLAWNVSLQISESDTLIRSFEAGAASGRLVYLKDEGVAVIDVQGLQPAPPDKTYEVWVITQGSPAPAGFLLVSEGGHASSAMRVQLSEGQAIAVTVEPAGGSQQPTSAPILQTEI